MQYGETPFLPLAARCALPGYEIWFYLVNINAGISPGNTITHLKYLTQGLGSSSDSIACWWAIRNKHCYVTFKTWHMSSKINDSFNGFRYRGPSPASALRSYLWPGLNWVSLCVSFEKPLWSKPFTGFIRMLWKFLCREQKQSNYYVYCINAKKKIPLNFWMFDTVEIIRMENNLYLIWYKNMLI